MYELHSRLHEPVLRRETSQPQAGAMTKRVVTPGAPHHAGGPKEPTRVSSLLKQQSGVRAASEPSPANRAGEWVAVVRLGLPGGISAHPVLFDLVREAAVGRLPLVEEGGSSFAVSFGLTAADARAAYVEAREVADRILAATGAGMGKIEVAGPGLRLQEDQAAVVLDLFGERRKC